MDEMAKRDVLRLDAAESMMREVMFAPEVNRWWPDVIPELLLALEHLNQARKALNKPIDISDV